MVGKSPDDDIISAPTQIIEQDTATFRYGTLFCGLDLCPEAWPNAMRVFSCDPLNKQKVAPGRKIGPTDHSNYHRVNWTKQLKASRPDLLVVCQPPQTSLKNEWEETFLHGPQRPPTVLVVDTPESLVRTKGACYKRWCRGMEDLGYEVPSWYAQVERFGAAIWDGHMVTLL